MRWGEMVRRLVLIPPTLVGVAAIVFVLLRIVPGDPIAMMIPPGASPADIERLRQMAGFDVEHARTACDVPSLFEPAIVMAIGHAGDPDRLEVEKHRAAELQPRERRPIDAFVFDGVWGAGFGSSK